MDCVPTNLHTADILCTRLVLGHLERCVSVCILVLCIGCLCQQQANNLWFKRMHLFASLRSRACAARCTYPRVPSRGGNMQRPVPKVASRINVGSILDEGDCHVIVTLLDMCAG